jgi:hypothetical protein
VKSCTLEANPDVSMTATRSLAPTYRLTNSLANARGPGRCGMEVVHYQHEEPPLEGTRIGRRIGRDGRLCEERRVDSLHWNVDGGKHGQRLGLAVLADFEVVLRQIADEFALGIGDLGVDLDVVHVDFERQRRLRRLRRLRRGGRLPRRRQADKRENDGCCHKGVAHIELWYRSRHLYTFGAVLP